jgi:hypothetical protein
MRKHLLVLGGAALLFGLVTADFGYAQFGQPKKKKEEKPKPPKGTVVESRTNLDDEQQHNLARLEKYYEKLYGHTGDVPEEAMQRLREVTFSTFNGIHYPERKHSDKVADQFADVVRTRSISAHDAHEIIRDTAEFLGEDEFSREALDGLLVDARKVFTASQLPNQRVDDILVAIEEMIKNAKTNKDKVEARDEARKKQEEKEEKELKKKLEEEKKKQKAKSSGRNRGSRRGGGSSAGYGSGS